MTSDNISPDAPLREKYVFKPRPGSSHHWALATLRSRISGAEVLDIGAGAGFVGRALKGLGAGVLTAVETDATARADLRAAGYAVVHECVGELGGRRYDAVLLLDVLEHMADPFQMARGIGAWLKPGGVALISVPNVAHWSVRLPLLFGRFDYRSRGILDRTHLHFFTRAHFRELLASVKGCQIAGISSSIAPAELALPETKVIGFMLKIIAPVRRWLARKLPGIFAYQHLAMIKAET
ncbi:MAG: methyltransferase domain-containing protein [Verrucomicrobiales bacterium]|jgi:2-polyprenyl-3-methyl-5-hydroxy-6-metoxy-1,4-benzoquinol methylase|nr:methyltransferase domain-containing protein [Verrucomicrobiales bacterium]